MISPTPIEAIYQPIDNLVEIKELIVFTQETKKIMLGVQQEVLFKNLFYRENVIHLFIQKVHFKKSNHLQYKL